MTKDELHKVRRAINALADYVTDLSPSSRDVWAMKPYPTVDLTLSELFDEAEDILRTERTSENG